MSWFWSCFSRFFGFLWRSLWNLKHWNSDKIFISNSTEIIQTKTRGSFKAQKRICKLLFYFWFNSREIETKERKPRNERCGEEEIFIQMYVQANFLAHSLLLNSCICVVSTDYFSPFAKLLNSSLDWSVSVREATTEIFSRNKKKTFKFIWNRGFVLSGFEYKTLLWLSGKSRNIFRAKNQNLLHRLFWSSAQKSRSRVIFIMQHAITDTEVLINTRQTSNPFVVNFKEISVLVVLVCNQLPQFKDKISLCVEINCKPCHRFSCFQTFDSNILINFSLCNGHFKFC